MRSIEIPGDEPVLILFHGTGGDENDLIPLIRSIAPDTAICSYRGITSEQGMLRWFSRHGHNAFDESEVRDHIERIMAGIREDFSDEQIAKSVLVGYSNGANAIGVMLQLGFPIRRAALLHPMRVVSDDADLSGVDLFVSLGESDTMIPPQQTQELIDAYKKAGAKVTVFRSPGGHGIDFAETEALASWLKTN